MLEGQQGRIEGQRFNLEQVQFTQEQIQTNIQTVNAMKASNEVMKKQMKQIKIDDVDDVMFDMEDMLDDANEISDMLAQGVGETFDEDEIDAEFEALAMDDTPISLDGLDGGAMNESPQAQAGAMRF
ncbi:Charged multivesicular body protein [Tritrichomonas foetus]|uniref:Charged multivesicular body protein n=1 Tax=Tritrichomonas foetus TaxID=1144522 RepID=A0A1J4KAZ7_9EUKA|nr:Charged multivesicular body protein [Tritrichomonas foetus]|eukprot:OHT08072.1 Charged multivesicular body protein [Tritrichomonas foetus]